jgi:hypothetical protein
LKDRKYNGEKKTDEKTNNDLQNTNTENYRLSNTNPTEKLGIERQTIQWQKENRRKDQQ